MRALDPFPVPAGLLWRIDVERIIGDIQQVEEMFEASDIRPLSRSDISAANRSHDAKAGKQPMVPASVAKLSLPNCD